MFRSTKVHAQGHQNVIWFADVKSVTVPNVFDGIHIRAPAWPLKIFNPLLCKRMCNVPYVDGLYSSEIWGVLLHVLVNVDTQ